MTRRPVDLAAVAASRRRRAAATLKYPELISPAKQARLAAWAAEQEEPATMAEKKRATARGGLTEVIHFRVAPEDLARLDALSERIPVASRNTITRAALRLGITALEEDPARFLQATVTPPASGRKRS
ncbi:MAG: hypothetical protein HYY25_13380 [Candidatus Wallbacteria bacterium]|nr:hypothetical protein [Candidatus Wallbacteria bacterium]